LIEKVAVEIGVEIDMCVMCDGHKLGYFNAGVDAFSLDMDPGFKAGIIVSHLINYEQFCF
jgi:hypothetical protein